MAEPELVAKLLIDNTQAMKALADVEREGVDAMDNVGQSVDQMPAKFAGWQVALELVGAALDHVGAALERAVELAAKNADINDAAFREYQELQKVYDTFLESLGKLILENEDFGAALQQVSDILITMAQDGTLEDIVNSTGEFTRVIAELLPYLREMGETMNFLSNPGNLLGINQIADSFRSMSPAVEETASAYERLQDEQDAANKKMGDAVKAAEAATLATEALAQQVDMLTEAERVHSEAQSVYDEQQQAAIEARIERQKKLADWVEATNKRVADRDALILETQTKIADMYLVATENEKAWFEQAYADIDTWVAKTLEGYDNVDQRIRLHLAEMNEESRQRVELYEIYINSTDSRFKWWLEQQHEGIKGWKDEWFDATASTEEKLAKMYKETTSLNISGSESFFGVADAVRTIGDEGVDALRRMGEEAGVFRDRVGGADGKLTGTTSFASSGIDVGSNVRFLKGLGLSNSEVQEMILGSSGDLASAIGREVAAALAMYADRDGTIQLSQAGVR